MHTPSPLWLGLLLVSGLAAAQMPPPAPGINRNPAYREDLPPNPVPPPDERHTVVPNPKPGDPRDSDTRPVLSPTSRGEDDAVPAMPSTNSPADARTRSSDSSRR